MLNATLARIDAALAVKAAILDTYEGMAATYDGESEYPAHVFDRIDDLKVEIATLESEYNAALIAAGE